MGSSNPDASKTGGGSSHWAMGQRRVADSLGEGNLICFPVSHVYFFVEEGQSL